ncbi:MAG TPA: hypothetical protein VMW17_10660 [Candidatus Binatia bacterium]|nr:hypothetical protein [Candidatus Binatia bacterium]
MDLVARPDQSALIVFALNAITAASNGAGEALKAGAIGGGIGAVTAGALATLGLKFYHLNHLGSAEVISTLLGTFEHVRYSPYGAVRGHYDANGNSLTNGGCTPDGLCREFTEYDTEPISNLEDAGARFYDPCELPSSLSSPCLRGSVVKFFSHQR